MNDDRQPPQPADATPIPRVDPDLNRDAAEDLVWPPPLEDIAACSVVPLDAAELDHRLLLIGGFPMAEADPRLRSKRLVDGEPMLPVTIGGFPVRERAPLFAAPPPLPHPMPPPLPEFAAAAEPPPLPVAPEPEPELVPAAVAAAPIEIPPVVPAPILVEPALTESFAPESFAAEPFAPEPFAPEPIAPEPIAEAVFFAPALMRRPLADPFIASDAAMSEHVIDGAPVLASAEVPTRIDGATIERLFTSTGLWGVRRVEAIRRPVEMAALLREPSSSSLGPRSRIGAALLVAASLALVSWSEFRAQRRIVPEVPVAASERPATPAAALAKAPTPTPAPVPAAEPEPEPVPAAPEPIALPTAPDPPAPKVAKSERREVDRDEALRPTIRRVAATPVRWPSRPAVLPSMPTRPLPAPYATARVTSAAMTTPAPKPAASTPVPAPAPAPVVATPSPMRAAASAPAASFDTPAPIETSVRLPSEEDNVRAILARWRTAYSQLDARAAKGVYPGLDQRALERAFQNLKSQDVRFDHCEFKVRDESAQADCVGRAIYVPRIGSQTPITAPRAWRFELKRYDQGWTIASARSS